MSVRDIASDIGMQYMGATVCTADGDFYAPAGGDGIDVAHYDSGFSVGAYAENIGAGNHVMTLQDSPDKVTWTDIPADKIINPNVDAIIDLVANTLVQDNMFRLGAFSNERYVRVKITKTNHVADTILRFFAAKKGEIRPVESAV